MTIIRKYQATGLQYSAQFPAQRRGQSAKSWTDAWDQMLDVVRQYGGQFYWKPDVISGDRCGSLYVHTEADGVYIRLWCELQIGTRIA
jgi:hypothetical protein